MQSIYHHAKRERQLRFPRFSLPKDSAVVIFDTESLDGELFTTELALIVCKFDSQNRRCNVLQRFHCLIRPPVRSSLSKETKKRMDFVYKHVTGLRYDTLKRRGLHLSQAISAVQYVHASYPNALWLARGTKQENTFLRRYLEAPPHVYEANSYLKACVDIVPKHKRPPQLKRSAFLYHCRCHDQTLSVPLSSRTSSATASAPSVEIPHCAMMDVYECLLWLVWFGNYDTNALPQ